MAAYIHTSVSHSACGINVDNQPLNFSANANTQLKVDEHEQVGFYAMQGLGLDTSESRLFNSLKSAVEQVIQTSGLNAIELKKTALLLGSTSLDIGTLSPSEDKALGLSKIDRLSQYLQQYFGLNSLHLVVNTACTASINALIYGKKLMEQSSFKHVLVVGCEFYNQLTVAGFHSLDLISSTRLKAFHQHRDGLILGEGIGVLLLSSEKPPNKPCYKILEGHSSCDTFSITMTEENGSHIKTVISQAVTKSGLSANDIDLVKVHGTATYNNDIAECNALLEYFSCRPPILALKPFTGHTLGACGAIEIALMDYLLSTDGLPMFDWVEEDDQSGQAMLPFVTTDKSLKTFEHVLVNHCGFGGNNAALVLKAEH